MDKKLTIKNTSIDGVYTIDPSIHEDSRGLFLRVYCDNELNNILKENTIRQINHSATYKKGTVRGMHFQYPPNSEIKFVKCIKGKILDIVVDIRKNSPTFLKTFSVELSADKKNMIYIPKGFAHGFQTLEDDTELLYLHSDIYTPNNEGTLNVKDPLLNIKLPLDIIEISKRDEGCEFLNKNFRGIEV